MGQAKARGSFEERKALAIARAEEQRRLLEIELDRKRQEQTLRRAAMSPGETAKEKAVLSIIHHYMTACVHAW